MSYQAKIEKLKTRIIEIADQVDVLGKESFSLKTEGEALLAEMVLSEKLLSGTEWDIGDKFKSSKPGTAKLRITHKVTAGDPLEKLAKLTQKDFHSWFYLSTDIEMRIDHFDGDQEDISFSSALIKSTLSSNPEPIAVINLAFEDIRMVLPFAKKHNLTLSGGQNIVQHIKELKRQVSAYEQICHELGI